MSDPKRPDDPQWVPEDDAVIGRAFRWSIVVLLLLGLLGIYLYIAVAKIPGQKARERGHPQADAINILGWIGPFLGIAGWVIALIWAHTNPPRIVVVARDADPGEVARAVADSGRRVGRRGGSP